MKIAHVVSTFPPYYGGMGNSAFEIASGLLALEEDVTVFTPMYPARPDEGDSEDRARFAAQHDFVRRLSPSFSYGNAASLPALRHELAPYDVVHLHYPFFGAGNAILRWKKDHPDKKLVLTYHMDTRASDWRGIIFALYAKFFLPRMLASADACIGASFDYIASSFAGKHFDENKKVWSEIPFGVRSDIFYPRDTSAVKKSLGIEPSDTVFLFVGGMDEAHYFKGVKVFLDALSILRGVNGWRAVLVGDGSLREGFMIRAKGLGIAGRVIFLGSLEQAALAEIYALADLTVLPSTTGAEAFGMVLLESYASGVPVLASDIPGVRSVASAAGKVFPAGDKLALAEALGGFLSSGASVREEYKQAALRAVEEKYSIDSVAKAHILLYKSLFSSPV